MKISIKYESSFQFPILTYLYPNVCLKFVGNLPDPIPANFAMSRSTDIDGILRHDF